MKYGMKPSGRATMRSRYIRKGMTYEDCFDRLRDLAIDAPISRETREEMLDLLLALQNDSATMREMAGD